MSVEIAKLVAHSYWNRKEIFQSNLCACFNCLARFEPGDIIYWFDSDDPDDNDPGGRWTDLDRFIGFTAMCPKCEDAFVLGDACGVELTDDILIQARKYWDSK